MKEKLYSFYKVSCEVTGLCYIGCTSKTLKKRWGDHRSMAKTNPTTNFHKAIKEFGEESFQIELLESGIYTRKDAVVREEELIIFYNTRDCGYNMSWSRKGEVNGWFKKGATNTNFTDPSKNPSIGKIQLTAKPVKVNDLEFPTISHAARYFSIDHALVVYRCNAKTIKFKDWNFVDSNTGEM